MSDNPDAWEGLRKEARQVDKALERHLAALESFADIIKDETRVAVSPSSLRSETVDFPNKAHSLSARREGETNDHVTCVTMDTRPTLGKIQQCFNDTFSEVESGLRDLERILIAMEELNSGNLHYSKHTERFRGILSEKRRSLNHITSEFKRRRERLELLSGVGEKKDSYEEESGVQLLMKEQGAIRHTVARVSEIVAQTTATQVRLRAQREMFTNVGGKLLQIVERVPMIKNVLSHINSRRRREAVVLGSLISFGFFIIVLFL